MRHKLLPEEDGQRTFVLVFDKGDEVAGGLTGFARDEGVGAASFTAVGAFSDATLGYFDQDSKEYLRIPVEEQVEVLSLLGDVALKSGEPQVHAHVVVGRSDGTTLEVVLLESPDHLQKTPDGETGLALIDVGGG